MWPAEPVRQGANKSELSASGTGKHAAEHMMQGPDGYASKLRSACGRAGRLSGDTKRKVRPKGEAPKAKPGERGSESRALTGRLPKESK